MLRSGVKGFCRPSDPAEGLALAPAGREGVAQDPRVRHRQGGDGAGDVAAQQRHRPGDPGAEPWPMTTASLSPRARMTDAVSSVPM